MFPVRAGSSGVSGVGASAGQRDAGLEVLVEKSKRGQSAGRTGLLFSNVCGCVHVDGNKKKMAFSLGATRVQQFNVL